MKAKNPKQDFIDSLMMEGQRRINERLLGNTRVLPKAELWLYLRAQAKRIEDTYHIKFRESDLQRIFSFQEEHLRDSHALCDLLETLARILADVPWETEGKE